MEEVKGDIKEIKNDIGEIKVDLRTHIKRTNLLEDKINQVETDVKPVITFISFAKWFIFIGAIIGATLTINKAVAKPYRLIQSIVKQIQKDVPCHVVIHSHWRSVKRNKLIGGSRNSLHITGQAMDISAYKCLTHKQLGKIAFKYATVIIYPTHVHIDERTPHKCMYKVGKKFQKWYRWCTKLER